MCVYGCHSFEANNSVLRLAAAVQNFVVFFGENYNICYLAWYIYTLYAYHRPIWLNIGVNIPQIASTHVRSIYVCIQQ